MKKTIKAISGIIEASQEHIRDHLIQPRNSAISFYRNSIHKIENGMIAMARDHQQRFLMVFSERQDGVITRFTGEQIGDCGVQARLCPLDATNAVVIRELFPWTVPISLRRFKTTIGCGDRLGFATPGHAAAVREYPEVRPVFAQQSVRELEQTHRTFRQVVDDAVYGVFQVGYDDGYGADGDHLKTLVDVEAALEAGMPMISLDLSKTVNAAAANWSDAEIDAAFANLPEETRSRVIASYADKDHKVGEGVLRLDAAAVKRRAVMYDKVVNAAAEMNRYIGKRRGKDAYDLEISIDEAETPTLPECHLYLILELQRRQVAPFSIAPRFVGEFQKAVDYVGNLNEFSRQFTLHRDIAATYGGYRLSIHSGSDKLTIYPLIGKITSGYCHVKTAGTAWLGALRVIAQCEPVLFKVIYNRALRSFNKAKELYRVSSVLSDMPEIETRETDEYVSLLRNNHVRQLLHITYGAVLNTDAIRPEFFAALHTHEELYHEIIRARFEKHLDALLNSNHR